MTGFAHSDPLFSARNGSKGSQRLRGGETARIDKPCRGGDLPEWVRLRRPTNAAPSSRIAIKPTAPSLNDNQDRERVLPMYLLTVAETASFFQVSEKTIRRMIARGELSVSRIGRSVRIASEAIEKIVRQNE